MQGEKGGDTIPGGAIVVLLFDSMKLQFKRLRGGDLGEDTFIRLLRKFVLLGFII